MVIFSVMFYHAIHKKSNGNISAELLQRYHTMLLFAWTRVHQAIFNITKSIKINTRNEETGGYGVIF